MPTIRIAIMLPYRIGLPDGEYPTSIGGAIWLRTDTPGEGAEPRTEVYSHFEAEADPRPDEAERVRKREAERLLRRTNHLLRRFRAASLQADVVEFSLAQAGPFRFVEEGTGDDWAGPPLAFALPIAPTSARSTTEIAAQVRASLRSGQEPDVGELNILDAQHAANSGRFREAVLLAWSAIDATFTGAYRRALTPLLDGEWASGREHMIGTKDDAPIEIPLRVRMTAVLYLAKGRSLFRELGPDDWGHLSASYAKRNGVIHRGEPATHDDAEQAIRVARQVVSIAREL